MPLVKKWQLDKHEDDSDIHHREWNWADEQGFHRRFVLPFADQYGWTKQGSVFQKGASGKFDDQGVHHPCVVKYGEYYYLFYAGIIAGNYYNGIGVARSTNPSGPFTRLNNGNAIIPTVAGTTYARIGSPSVIYDDYEIDSNKKWKAFFVGNESPSVRWRIHYVYSANPDSGWSTPTIILDGGSGVDLAAVSCIRIGKLFYLATSKTNVDIYLYVCDTPTGTWTGIGTIINKGSAGQWDAGSVDYIAVTYILGIYYLFYSGSDGTNYRIGMAMSPTASLSSGSLTQYLKYVRNPVLNKGSTGEFDVTHAFCPSLLQNEDKFHMWYAGANPTDRQIGLATIP